jgi:hypothetical protein
MECNNISITFDPFLTLALPIARPFKMTIRFVAYDQFYMKEFIDRSSQISKKPVMTYIIPLTKEQTIGGLK